jgi:hypothetical protein
MNVAIYTRNLIETKMLKLKNQISLLEGDLAGAQDMAMGGQVTGGTDAGGGG